MPCSPTETRCLFHTPFLTWVLALVSVICLPLQVKKIRYRHTHTPKRLRRVNYGSAGWFVCLVCFLLREPPERHWPSVRTRAQLCSTHIHARASHYGAVCCACARPLVRVYASRPTAYSRPLARAPLRPFRSFILIAAGALERSESERCFPPAFRINCTVSDFSMLQYEGRRLPALQGLPVPPQSGLVYGRIHGFLFCTWCFLDAPVLNERSCCGGHCVRAVGMSHSTDVIHGYCHIEYLVTVCMN